MAAAIRIGSWCPPKEGGPSQRQALGSSSYSMSPREWAHARGTAAPEVAVGKR